MKRRVAVTRDSALVGIDYADGRGYGGRGPVIFHIRERAINTFSDDCLEQPEMVG